MWVIHANRFTLLLHIASLIRIARAATVVANYWKNGDCEGPPASITSFNMKDTSAKAPINESWPDVFRQVTRLYYLIGSCTNGMVPHIGARKCCITNLETDVLWSVSYDTIGDSSISETIPATTNGIRYCSVKSISTDKPWYNVLHVQTGQCAEGFLCGPMGNLTMFNSGICDDYKSKGYQNLTMTMPLTYISAKERGTFTVAAVTFQDSTLTYGWKAYVPFTQLVPDYQKEPSEFFAIIIAAIAFLAILITMNYFGRRYIKSRLRIDLLHAIGQLIWLSALALNIAFVHYSTSDFPQLSLITAFSYAIKNFATFYSAVNNIAVILDVSGIDERVRLICYACLLIMHVGCSGSDYAQYWRVSTGRLDSFTYWGNISPIWLTVSELTVFFPVLLLLFKVTAKKHGKHLSEGRLYKYALYIFNADPKFTRLFLISVTFLATFAVLSIIDSSFIGIYGSERVQISFQLIRICFQLLPFTMNCFVTQHLPELVAKLKRMKMPQRKKNAESENNDADIPMKELQPTCSHTVKLSAGDMF
jgi:hypothetical protein